MGRKSALRKRALRECAQGARAKGARSKGRRCGPVVAPAAAALQLATRASGRRQFGFIAARGKTC